MELQRVNALSSDSLFTFVEELSAWKDHGEDLLDEGETETPPATPRPVFRDILSETEFERKRLERMVIEDLNLTLDYTAEEPVATPQRLEQRSKSKVKLSEFCGHGLNLSSNRKGRKQTNQK